MYITYLEIKIYIFIHTHILCGFFRVVTICDLSLSNTIAWPLQLKIPGCATMLNTHT